MPQIIHEYIKRLKAADEQLEQLLTNRLKFQPQFKFRFDYALIISKDLQCLYTSTMGARYFGLNPFDMVDKNWREFSINLPTEFFEPLDDEIREVFNTGNSIKSEVVISDAQGDCYFEYILSPLFSSRGDIEAVMINVTDITERKIAAITLSNQIFKFNQLIDLCPFGIVVHDHESKVSAINKTYYDRRLPNYKKEDFLGRPGQYLATVLGLDWEKSVSYRALKGREILNCYTKKPHGTYLINAVPLRNCKNMIVGAMTVIHDITEYEKLKEEMAKLDRLNLVGEMAAGVAHEIRNPMTVVKGYLQFLSQKVSDSMVEQFRTALDELDRVEQIITDFLSLAINKLTEYQEQGLNTIIEGLLPLIHTDAIKRGINLEVNLTEGIPDLLLNDNEIKQLLLNLIRNGMEAMNQHGTLAIATSVKDDMVRLCIADCGCGISKEDQGKIFDPFFTTKDNGTGLGLAVCAGIVRRHSGTIEFQSEEGKGTQFIITFNVASEIK